MHPFLDTAVTCSGDSQWTTSCLCFYPRSHSLGLLWKMPPSSFSTSVSGVVFARAVRSWFVRWDRAGVVPCCLAHMVSPMPSRHGRADFIGGGIAFCVAIVILLVLGVAVFGRALSRIAQVNRGVNDVVIAMTALEVGKVLANTAKAVAKVRKMHGLVGELLVGEEHDFDDGGIDATFTYEEDQDAKRAREHSRFSSEREPRNVRFATPGEPKTKTTPSVRFQSPRVVRFQSPREPVRSEDNENMLASIADEKSGPMDEGSPLLLPNSVSSDEEGDVSSTARVSDSEDDSVGSPRKIPHLDGLEGLAAGRDDDDALCPVDEIPAGLMRPTTLMGSSSRVVGLGGKNPTLGQVVGASPGVCVLTDCIGTVLFVNNAFTKMLGYTAEYVRVLSCQARAVCLPFTYYGGVGVTPLLSVLTTFALLCGVPHPPSGLSTAEKLWAEM